MLSWPLSHPSCPFCVCPSCVLNRGEGLWHCCTLAPWGRWHLGLCPERCPPCSFSRHLFGSLASVMYYLHILRTPCKCLLEMGIWIVKGAISIAHSELLENFTLCFSCNSLSKNKKDKTNWHCLKVKGIPGQMLQLWAVAAGRETHRCCRACGRAAPHLP